MEKRLKAASILLYVVSAIMILSGIIYSMTPTILPFHERFLGKTHNELDPKIAYLLLQSARIMGACFLSIGAALIMLVKKNFTGGDNWTRWTIFIMMMIALLPMLKVTLSIGIYTTWWLVAIGIILVVTAFIISRPGKR